MGGMKALVKTQAGPGLELMDVPMPEVGPNDVLIKIHKTAICGTDLHIWNWDKWAQQTIPVGMHVGHEFCGVIEAVGSSVTEYKPGEIVSGEGHIVCGHCRSCRSGQKHLCPNTKGVGVNRPGCFAEYLSIPQDNVVRIHKSIPMEIASIFDPLGNAVHTALSWDLVGEDVLITGAGVIGCMAAAVCKKAGAKTVVITDINDFRLGLAKTLDEDITKLLDTNDNLSVTKAAVFCAMDYLDEYRKSTGSAENMRSQIQDYIADAARAKLAEDKALAENAVLRREAAALREQLAKERQRETRREERAARAAAETAQEQPAPEAPAADSAQTDETN